MPSIVSSFSRRAGLALVALTVTLAGCSSDKWGFPYRPGVQQGNWITQEQIALLQPGMTREQVRFALGSPTLTSVLHSDRWDYPYFYQPGFGTAQHREFTVWFENDRLARWEGDAQPDLQPFQQARAPLASERVEETVERDEAREKEEAPISGRRIDIQPVDATRTLPSNTGNPEPLR